MSALMAFARQVHTAAQGVLYIPGTPAGCVAKTTIVVSHQRFADLMTHPDAFSFFKIGPPRSYRGMPIESEDEIDDRDVIIRHEVTAPRWRDG